VAGTQAVLNERRALFDFDPVFAILDFRFADIVPIFVSHDYAFELFGLKNRLIC
jgi:hypothetical protein